MADSPTETLPFFADGELGRTFAAQLADGMIEILKEPVIVSHLPMTLREAATAIERELLTKSPTHDLIVLVGALSNLSRNLDDLALRSDVDRTTYVVACIVREMVYRLAQLVAAT